MGFSMNMNQNQIRIAQCVKVDNPVLVLKTKKRKEENILLFLVEFKRKLLQQFRFKVVVALLMF